MYWYCSFLLLRPLKSLLLPLHISSSSKKVFSSYQYYHIHQWRYARFSYIAYIFAQCYKIIIISSVNCALLYRFRTRHIVRILRQQIDVYIFTFSLKKRASRAIFISVGTYDFSHRRVQWIEWIRSTDIFLIAIILIKNGIFWRDEMIVSITTIIP